MEVIVALIAAIATIVVALIQRGLVRLGRKGTDEHNEQLALQRLTLKRIDDLTDRFDEHLNDHARGWFSPLGAVNYRMKEDCDD